VRLCEFESRLGHQFDKGRPNARFFFSATLVNTTHSTEPSKTVSAPLDKIKAAWVSLLVTFLLLLGKLVIGLLTGSLVILSLAAESGVDLASVLITLLAVRISSIPPDEDHPYGHGKFESLSALVEGLLLFLVTVWIAFHAVQHLLGAVSAVVVNAWSFGILIVSVGLDAWRARTLRRAAKRHHSNALDASALHFFTDSLSSLVAIVALLLIQFAGFRAADDIGALLVAGFVAYLSLRMILRAIHALTDRITSFEQNEAVRTIIAQIPGIEELTRLRLRQGGPVLFVEASVTINRVLPYAAIQRIIADIETKILESFPNADVTVHWRPVRSEIEAPFETIKIVAGEFGLLPHNIELSETKEGQIALDYHLEFAPGTSLVDAEALSRRVEARLREELPDVGPIFVHLEEERSDRKLPKVEDIEPTEKNNIDVVKAIAREADESVQAIEGVHFFREPEEDHLKLVLTARVSQNLSLRDAHQIATNVEAALRKRFPEISRIVIQAASID